MDSNQRTPKDFLFVSIATMKRVPCKHCRMNEKCINTPTLWDLMIKDVKLSSITKFPPSQARMHTHTRARAHNFTLSIIHFNFCGHPSQFWWSTPVTVSLRKLLTKAECNLIINSFDVFVSYKI